MQKNSTRHGSALGLLSSLFFMWGFITCLNDIMIPHLKGLFEMNNLETMLIQFTFFGAYALMSLPAGYIVGKTGYQKGLVLGLAITGIGAVLFWPASIIISYGFFLFAFFTLATGITIIQVAANPFVSVLGSPETASSRLNLTQALNALGTTIAPIFGAMLIFVSANASVSEQAESVQIPYIAIGFVLFALAAVFLFVKLPKIEHTNDIKNTDNQHETVKSAWGFPHLVKGFIGIFMYVGAEVTIGSFMILFFATPEMGGLGHDRAAMFVSFYWGGAMIGRFLGAIILSSMKDINRNKYYLLIGTVTLLAFILGLFIQKNTAMFTAISSKEVINSLIFSGFTVFNILCFSFGKNKPARTLAIFALSAASLIAITVLTHGAVAMWAIIAVGLFNSIMFPTIFTLAIDGLGSKTSQGSGILCMGIVGGALIPVITGWMADLIGYHYAFSLTIICYLYITYYGLKGYKHT